MELKEYQQGVLHKIDRYLATLAKAHAESEFEKYRIVQDRLLESDFDRMVKQLDTGNKEGSET